MPLEPGVVFFGPNLPVHTFVGAKAGPTVVMQAAIHGDEIAGAHALMEMLEDGVDVQAGKLIVIPVMNPAAYRARERAAPGGLDLNRQFPGDVSAPEVERRLAAKFFGLMLDERPAMVTTLHESKKRYDPEVKPSFGQTIVYGVDPRPPVVDRLVEHLNATRLSADEWWAPQYYPVATSSTEQIVDAVGCVGLCIETWMGFPERRRIEMQRLVVEFLLSDAGITAPR